MRKNTYFAFAVIFMFGMLGLSACSKDDNPDPIAGDASFTMKVGGEPWRASITSLLTEDMSDSEQGDFRYVFFAGTREAGVDAQTGEIITEMIHLYVAIPSAKFNDPRGTYPITLQPEKIDYATAIFARGSTVYVGRNANDHDQPVGVVEITGFKIGAQHVAGQPTGTEGYTRLSGTFHADLMSTDDPDGPPLKISDGKFDLSVGIIVQD